MKCSTEDKDTGRCRRRHRLFSNFSNGGRRDGSDGSDGSMEEITLEKIAEKYTGRKPGIAGDPREFSVLMPLVLTDEGLSFLYEKRSSKLDSQPGEVCFPGGAVEKGETPREAAVRETVEELGIGADAIRVIAEADMILTPANKVLYSFIGTVDAAGLRPSPDEVDEIFTVPVSFFMENEPRIEHSSLVQHVDDDFPYEAINFPEGYKWAGARNEIPIYTYGDRIIWGLTGRMTREFVRVMKGEKR